ncbi:MAG: ATP-dependent DNA helicase RecG [Eggerthellaceae bacterium]|nr:ATP-dependent DNA helicase RecG [Eggerthellaceae bacterium]
MQNNKSISGTPGQINRLSATLALDEPVTRVQQVSPVRAQGLKKLGITTIRDLVTNYPRRYVNMSVVVTIENSRIGQPCSISGKICHLKLKTPRPRFKLVEVTVNDGTGTLIATMFQQPWLMDQLSIGEHITVSGKVEFNYGYKRMSSPYIEHLDGEIAEGKVIPIHPATEKLSVTWIRKFVSNALKLIEGTYDPLPLDLRRKYRLMSRGPALSAIQFPQSMDEVTQARRRLVYEEIFLLELHLMMEGLKRARNETPVQHNISGKHLEAFDRVIPFELTDEQISAKNDILRVMASPTLANHMILGDVGTGKTIVAAFALAAAADSSGQALFMAPTEVLARQHMQTLGPLLADAGIKSDLLTGSTPAPKREQILKDLADGTLDVLFGTHALIEPDVIANNMTLAVIDEQQRFGVEQRAALLSKGSAPDALYLTATPIPRTLALALFGNLTFSYLKKRPIKGSGRTTKVLSKSLKGQAYDAAREALKRGERVFVVCPLIGRKDIKTEDEEDGPSISIETDADFLGDDIASATKQASFLQQKTFYDWKVDLLHGAMKPAEKHEVMERFRSGESQVLVSTTVIEVGVDVPEATVMIIEDADRFGLSQLHQLRGRVGRGKVSGQVFLISSSKQESAMTRLMAMESTDDGFELAQYDLSLRREGDILGNRQSGASILKLVNIARDGKIIEAAHSDARAILDVDPDLSDPDPLALAREVRILFGTESDPIGG